jgi:prevent-host-death family protein
MLRRADENNRVVSALTARSHFGKLLDQVNTQNGSLVIEKRGTPRAVLLSVRDYVRLSAPEPEVLRLIGQKSRQRGTDRLTSARIDQIIRDTRKRKSKRR